MGDRCTTVAKRPPCDLCLLDNTVTVAYANARVGSDCVIYGWAYLCRRHFREQGCTLGFGCGQRLILPRKKSA